MENNNNCKKYFIPLIFITFTFNKTSNSKVVMQHGKLKMINGITMLLQTAANWTAFFLWIFSKKKKMWRDI